MCTFVAGTPARAEDRSANDGNLQTNMWPLPVEISVSGEPVPLAPNFKVSTSSKSARLARAIKRYSEWMSPTDGEWVSEGAAAALAGVEVTVVSMDENLTSSTSYGYHISVGNAGASIVGDTVYGAMYGLETFSQFVAGSKFNYSTLQITDKPQYKHRGLMIDTGRRFFPPALVETLLDGMSYMKLNVLHFHLSDLCRFAVESLMYPELTKNSQGFYTQEEIVSLVAYAKDRGIRVVPEFDVPGHSHGFVPLAEPGDVAFCSTTQKQLRNDDQNKTVTTLKRLFEEMATLFDDELFHIGCDETGKRVIKGVMLTCGIVPLKVSYPGSNIIQTVILSRYLKKPVI